MTAPRAEILSPSVLPLSSSESSEPPALRVLTTALARGDDTAWSQFHRDFGPRIFRQLLAATRGDHALASDALQQTYLRIARHARPCDAEPVFTAWLRVAARSALHDCWRKRRSFWQLLQRRHADPSDSANSADASPACADDEDHLLPALDAALAQLDAADRALLEAKYSTTPPSAPSPKISPSPPKQPSPVSPAPAPSFAATSSPRSPAMNKKPAQRDALLADTFSHHDFLTGPAAQFAQLAARHARRRRRARHLIAATSAAAVLGAVFALALPPRPRPPLAVARAAVAPPAYEIISDVQLLALVEDRPLLFISRGDGTGDIHLLED